MISGSSKFLNLSSEVTVLFGPGRARREQPIGGLGFGVCAFVRSVSHAKVLKKAWAFYVSHPARAGYGASWRHSRSGREGAFLNKTRDVEGRGSFGTSAGEERLPVVMERACLARVGERGKELTQQARAAVAHSDPQICHRNPPLFPAPRPSSIAYSNTGTSRVPGLSWVWGWHGLKPSRPSGLWRQLTPQPLSEGGRFPPAADPKPRWSPSGWAQSPLRGQERGESTAERARATGSTIREARERSRGSSRSEHDAAAVRARSGGVSGLPQTSPNVTRVTSPARRY